VAQVALAFAVLDLTGSKSDLGLLLAARSLPHSTAFFFPASSGVIPQTVPRKLLQQANAVLRLALNASSIVGAALGGIVVAAVGPDWSIAFDGATFLLGDR